MIDYLHTINELNKIVDKANKGPNMNNTTQARIIFLKKYIEERYKTKSDFPWDGITARLAQEREEELESLTKARPE